jgi:cyclophilin family peptidyl-prolyl cis-trans isomerase
MLFALMAVTAGLTACPNETPSTPPTPPPAAAPPPAPAPPKPTPPPVIAAPAPAGAATTPSGPKPVVVMTTSLGTVKIELDEEKAPTTVKNFLGYVDRKFYDGTIFHRVINGFMIQGGGFDVTGTEKPTQPPIHNESSNGLKNDRGTIAMARTQILDSATAQFYINVVDNAMLNYPAQGGYAVFGKVIEGMDVVDKIKAVPTSTQKMPNMPVTPVVIESIRRAT